MFGIAGEGIGKASRKTFKTDFGKAARWALNSDFAKTLSEAGFNGFFGEMMEEWAGNAVRLATGLIDKDEFSQFSSVQQQLEMAASFAPMTLVGLVGNAGSVMNHARRFDTMSENVKGILLKNGVSQPEIDDIFNKKYATADDIASALAPYAQKVLQNEGTAASDDYRTILDFAQEFGAKSFIDASKEIESENDRTQMRDVIASSAGQFWTDGENGSNVRVIERQDGTREYIMSESGDENARLYATVREDGSHGFINEIELKEGQDNGTLAYRDMGLDAFLQERVDAVKSSDEAARMNEEMRQKLVDVQKRVAAEGVINMGTPEAPRVATVIPEMTSPSGVVAVVDDGNGNQAQVQLTWQEVGRYMDTPISAQTDEEIAAAEAEEIEKADIRKEKYNTIPVGTPLNVEMGDGSVVPYQFAKAIHEENEEYVRIYVVDENGQIATDENGDEIWFPDMMVQGIDAISEVASNNVVTNTEEEAAEAEEIPAAEPAVKKYTDENGKVNQTVFMREDPEEWAKWNDERRGDGGLSSTQRINAAVSNLDKEISAISKDLDAEANPDIADEKEAQMDELVSRRDRLSAILDGYAQQIAAQQMAQQQEAQAENAQAEQPQEVQPEIVASAQEGQPLTKEQILADAQGGFDALGQQLAEATSEEERQILMDARAEVIRQMAEALGWNNVTVSTRAQIVEQFRNDGASDGLVEKLVQALSDTEERKSLRGFQVTGRVYLIADGIKSAQSAITTYVHENKHIENRETGAAAAALTTGVSRNEMVQALVRLTGGRFYSLKPEIIQADEIIAISEEIAETDGIDAIPQKLREVGIVNEEFINFVQNNIANGRGNDQRVSTGRADELQHGLAEISSGENGADTGAGAGEMAERPGSPARSAEAAEGAEPAAAESERAVDINPVGEPLSASVADELREKGLVMDGGAVMDEAQDQLKQEAGYKTPNELDSEANPVVGDIRFSQTTIDPWKRNYMTYPDAKERVVKVVENLADRISADELVYGVVPQGVYKYGEKSSGSKAGPLRTNIAYVVTFDIDTSCPRSLQYLEYVKRIEAQIGRPLTQTESIQLIEMMRAYGQMIPCVYCYCENKRQALKQYFTDFMKARNGVINAATEEEALAAMYGHKTTKEAKESKDPAVALTEPAYEVFQRWRQEKDYNPTMRQLWQQYRNDRNVALTLLDDMIDRGSVTTNTSDEVVADALCLELGVTDANARGALLDIISEWKWNRIEDRQHDDFVRVENEDDLVADEKTLTLWREMTLYGKSASGAKNVLRYVPYTDELKTLSQADRDYINGMGGLRMHSSNDFRIDYVLDYFQFMADMAVAKMMGHTYTKSPEFVRIFGNSGYKINMSIAAYEDSRGIHPNRDEGFEWNEAKELRRLFPNAGTMLMATSDAQVQFALDNDWIDMCIPFHHSGLPKAVWGNMRMWTDYSSTQNERFFNSDEMRSALEADGVEVPKDAKPEAIQKLYDEHFNVKKAIRQKGRNKGKRFAPHFLPGPTVVDGVTIPGHENNREKYLDLCRQYGVHPRFYGLKVKDNTPEGGGREIDITEHPQYMKFIKETARTDTPQTPIQFNFDQPSEALGGKTPIDYAFEELQARAMSETEMAGSPVRSIYESYKQDPFGIVPKFIDGIIKHKEETGEDLPLDYLTPDSRAWFMTERKALEDAYRDFDTVPYHPHEYDENGNLIMEEEKPQLTEAQKKALEFVNGKQDSEEEDMLFSVRGEIGAANDQLAMADLAVAEEMEKAGKGTKEIWLATGWEKGADGKWRNEIPDGKPKAIGSTRAKHTTGDVIDAPEVFSSYPEIKNYPVVFKNMKDCVGKFDPKTKTFYLHTKATTDYMVSPEDAEKIKKLLIDYVKSANATRESAEAYVEELYKHYGTLALTIGGTSTMMHEIQHAIQGIEGFAKGGNASTMMSDYFDVVAQQRPELVTFAKGWVAHYPAAKLINAGRSIMVKSVDLTAQKATNPDYIKQLRDLSDFLGSMPDSRYMSFVRQAKALINTAQIQGKEGYHKLAGEVESRNVQTRMGMTDEQRRNTPLSESEDTDRGDQIIRFSVVEDPMMIAELESKPKEVGYRSVSLKEDGTFGSPMADKLGSKGKKSVKTSPFELGKWEQSEENPDLATEDGKINLKKPSGLGGVDGVDYNPYIHIRPTKINKQFAQAWKRPDLVYIETQYPASELESGYQAEKAALPVGKHPWHNGELILSRWDKPTRVVPWEEVADDWVEEFKDSGVTFDIVNPNLLPILADRGVEILPPTGTAGKPAMEAYEKWRDGESEDMRFSVNNTFSKSMDDFDSMQKAAAERKGIVVDGLYNTSFPVKQIPQHDFSGTGKQAIEKAREWAEENLVGTHKYHDGQENEFTYEITGGKNGSIGKMLSGISTKNSDNLGVHLAVLKRLPDVIDASYDIEIHQDYNKENGGRSENNSVNPSTLIHRLYGAVDIDGQIYRVKTTILENRNKENGAYTYQVTKVELLISGSATSDALSNPTSVSATKLLNGVEKSYDSGKKVLDDEYLRAVNSGDMEKAQRMVLEAAKAAMPNTKVVDEDGNPLIVYHGSAETFNKFIIDGSGFENDLGDGAYFTDSKELAETYAAPNGDNQWRVDSFIDRYFDEHPDKSIIDENDFKEAEEWALMEAFKNGKVYAAFLNLENPRYAKPEDFNDDNSLKENTFDYQDGYDGVIDDTMSDRFPGFAPLHARQFVALRPSQIKSADPVTYDDSGSIIPLSQRFNTENDDIRFSVSEEANEETSKLFDAAKERFGTTSDLREAGYILPDGTMLDFSGRHWTEGGDNSWLNGMRQVDHREISDLEFEKDGNTPSGLETDMSDFIRRGAIRINYPNSINLSVKPTAEQRAVLERMLQGGGFVRVDFGDGNHTDHSADYEGVRPARVLNDIKRYFDEGYKPEGVDGIRFSVANENQDMFISNAEKAVKLIKQDKATPEQWLKMLEKNGGLKAAEDKWLGLSDWLKASDKKTLTKDEVAQFIAENKIQIEEQRYAENGNSNPDWTRPYEAEYQGYFDEAPEDQEPDEFAWNKMVEKYGEDFGKVFENDWSNLFARTDESGDDYAFPELAKQYYAGQVKAIVNTRLHYTTEGLKNNREIALTVPTIEPWNENDEIHFGDAGEGRAVAWIRFGDAVSSKERSSAIRAYQDAEESFYTFMESLKEKYGVSRNEELKGIVSEEEDQEVIRLHKEMLDKKNAAKHPESQFKTERVLVIDEIQSKRHQEGREKGYKDPNAKFDPMQNEDYRQLFKEYEYLRDVAAEERAKRQPRILELNQMIYGGKLSKDELEKAQQEKANLNGDTYEFDAKESEARERMKAKERSLQREYEAHQSDIPAAPFEKNWHELAMKRMLRLAAEEGYDYIAWTTGEQQAERYSLGGTVNKISVSPVDDGTREVTIESSGADIYLDVDENGVIVGQQDNYGENLRGKKLSDVVGKEMAVKIMSASEEQTIEGEGLRIGGEGMKGFYDDILPRFMNKYGKQWGVKVEDINLPWVGDNGLTMHSVPVTQEMKDSVLDGQMMFSVVEDRRDQEIDRQDMLRRVDEGGMPAAIGAENAKALYEGIYTAIPEDIMRPMVEKAMGSDMKVQTRVREYLHKLAQGGTENDKTGLLFAVYDNVRYLTGNNALTDEDIRYMLWKDTADRRDGDILSLAESQAMKNRWGVGEQQEMTFSAKGEFEAATSEAREKADIRSQIAKVNRTAEKKEAESEESKARAITKAMAAQKTYDKATVDNIVRFAKEILKNGGVSDLTMREASRLLTLVNNATGKSPKFTMRYANQLMDLLLDHIVTDEEAKLMKLVNTKASTVAQSGVEKQGKLDVMGQLTMKAFRDNIRSSAEEIKHRIEDLSDRINNKDKAVRDDAFAEYQGLRLAQQYAEDIVGNIEEGKDLKQEREAAKKTDDVSKAAIDEYKKSLDDAIMQNKLERIDSYRTFSAKLAGIISGSAEKAAEFREADKQRIEDIHHDANRDMQGVESKEHLSDGRIQRILNSDVVRFFFKSLGTFDQMLRLLGRKNVKGEGYLWNRYMRQLMESLGRKYRGIFEAEEELDKQASFVFGKDMIWSDLYKEERKLPKAKVTFMDGGELREHELSQGNLLYIYMVDKMVDGRMKLRHMGITEKDVEDIKKILDPRFIELADWLQNTYLVNLRNKYNEVHERMFGAPMAAIENYFPLKILSNARFEEVDLGNKTDGNQLSSTTTGSVIKRRKNSLALDIMHTDAFSLVIEHIEQMEDWAAMAEFRRDLNTLLSYKHFRNQVQNMDTIYGSGKTLWKNFMDAASIAAGNYRPKVGKGDLDTIALNAAKGVTAAKIAFRVNTAIKQLLSFPAYLPDANPLYLAKSVATPGASWRWCMENLPVFEQRWKSRIAGDTRLLDTESDWKIWRDNMVKTAGRLGLTPNAFVDATTVAIGAKAMYDTKKARYLRDGYSEEEADRRAKEDATILYNQTQQSSEGAFVSTVQLDRTWLSVMLSTYRNSSMAYQRQLHDSIRSLGRMAKPGYKQRSINFMAHQMENDGLDEEQAQKAAQREYNRQYLRNAARVAVFGYGLQLLWKVGNDMWYLLFGDDDDEKERILEKAILSELAAPVEGLVGGNVISDKWGKRVSKKVDEAQGIKTSNFGSEELATLPIVSDMKNIMSYMKNDKPRAVSEIIDLIAQSGIGVNPRTFSDVAVAFIDACGGDLDLAKEAAFFLMRVGQIPQSTIDKFWLDEIDMSAADARKMSADQLARRYAEYKVLKNAPYTQWMYNEAERQKKLDKYEKQFNDKVRERMRLKGDIKAPETVEEAYKRIDKEMRALQRQYNIAKEAKDTVTMNDITASPDWQEYLIWKKHQKGINALDKKIKNTHDDTLRELWQQQLRDSITAEINELSELKK